MTVLLIQPELSAPSVEELSNKPKLTEKELTVLTMLANGKTQKQITTRRRFYYRTARIRFKFQAETNEQAIARAVARGIIQVEL